MNLREAIERTLAGIGSKQILETIPELAALDSWTNKSLASALCDKNNLTFKDQALLALLSQLQPSPSSSSLSLDDHERKNLEDCIAKAELPHMSRDFSAGVLVPQLTGNVVGYIAVDGPSMAESNTSNSSSNMSDASMEFLPLVGISIGHQPGPLKATLDSIFLSGLHRSRSRNDVCTDFFRHILGLWKLVFHSWFNSSQRINNTDREESMVRITTIF